MTNAQPEPSMEEILASIRRIISEDDDGAAPAKPALGQGFQPPRPRAPAPAPQTPSMAEAAEPAAPRPSLVQERAFRAAADDDSADPRLETEDVQMIKKSAASTDEPLILADTAAAAATKAFQTLSHTVKVSRGDSKSLEEIVTEMLRPMIKDWLDQNLASIVEEKVEEEVQRVARRRT